MEKKNQRRHNPNINNNTQMTKENPRNHLQQEHYINLMRKHQKFGQFLLRSDDQPTDQFQNCDAFWEFLFSAHEVDRNRMVNFSRIVDIFDEHGRRGKLTFRQLNAHFKGKHGQELTTKFLRQMLSVSLFPPGQELEVFKRCGDVFKVDEQGNIHLIIDDLPDLKNMKNIFVSSAPILNAEMIRNVKLADKVFEIVPELKRINLNDLMDKLVKTNEYLDVKKKIIEAPHLEPIKFIGFLELYWGDVFKITPDHEKVEVWVSRRVLHHQKPSQEKKYMKEIMKTLPSYPIIFDLFTKEQYVKVYPTMLPTDGIGLQLLSLQAEFNYIKEELSKYYTEVMAIKDRGERKSKRLHANETYDGTCCLRTFRENEGVPEVFRRCRITGQSYGLAMVQDADYPWQGLVEVKTLHTIPRHFLGVRQTCVWGVAPGFGVDENNVNERHYWKKACKLMEEDVRCFAIFLCQAQRIDYSGRRKHTIYNVNIRIHRMGDPNPMPKLTIPYQE